ncbi:MAG: alpha/beta fold hydrolase [Cyanobacteria bacterium CRU_2_1]|nr:alpha/beta fold hydrolase [Cyanobacteria bacterium CRU_2_1]
MSSKPHLETVLRSGKSPRHWHHRWINGLVSSLVLALGWGITSPGLAAERLMVRLGPIQQSVAISDLEHFAETGEIPDGLRLYSPLLTEDIRHALRTRLQLDPNVGKKLVEDLLHSSAGERFLNTLQVAIPDTDAVQLQTALTQAAKQPDGISLLGFLKTLPEKTVTVDAGSAVALASQLNLPYWQGQMLSSVLDRELTVDSEPIQAKLDPTQSGPYWVWKQTLTLRDYERDRSIPVDLYWSRRTQGPLIVISHGFGADRRFLGYLAQHFASYGFTVAALEHPGSNVAWLTGDRMNRSGDKTGSILPASEFINRPKDVSFLLDRLKRLDRFSNPLRGKFNTDEVVIVGHSLGGYTALALAGAQPNLNHLRQFCNDPEPVMFSPADLLQCNAADLNDPLPALQDKRIVQAIVLNPVIGRLFDEQGLAQVKVPTLMLAASNDSITPAVSQQFLPFTQLHTSKYLLTAIGATHLSIGDPANLNRALTQSVFVRERQDDETESLRRLLKGVTLAFVNQLTPDAKDYAPFLTPAYAQSFSTGDLKLRLNAELPPNFANWLKMAALPMEQLVASTLSKNRSAHQDTCNVNLICLNDLPLVMFILPGMPFVSHQFFKLKETRRRRDRRKRGS